MRSDYAELIKTFNERKLTFSEQGVIEWLQNHPSPDVKKQ